MNPLPKLAPAATDAAAPAADPVYVAKATKAAIDFESFFISHMLQQMRSSTREMAGEDSVFNDRVNRDMQDMADHLLADNMAGQRAFGIADAVLRQLLPAPLNNSK
jgi:flagellar protein FlgJ